MTAELADGVPIDLGRLIVSRLLAQANAGAGKSWALRRLLEQTHGQVQQIVLDSEGEFHTLRERFDYVLGAPHGGDFAATPKTAALLARKLLELQVSAILDISELKTHERILFVRRFLEALVGAPRKLWHPVLLFLDEAHLYAPQKGSAESLAAVVDLMARGRKRGFCGILATQRISKIHKDAIAECNNMLIGRAALDVDMKRAADALGFHTREQQQELRMLKPGEFFTYGPALSDQIRRIHVGPVVTTHPKAGSAAPPATRPSETVRKVLAGLADLPAEADQELRTVDDLRAENARLKRDARELARRLSGPGSPTVAKGPSEAEMQRRMRSAVSEATGPLQARIRELEGNAKAHERYRKSVETAVERLTKITGTEPTDGDGAPVAKPAPFQLGRPQHGMPALPPPAKPNGGPVADGLTMPQQRIVDAIAWYEPLGLEVLSREQVAFVAGYRPTSGAFKNPLGALRSAGLIEYPSGGRVRLTAHGRQLANTPENPATTDALQQMVRGQLTTPQRRILDPVIANYPADMDRETLAELAGYQVTSGAFKNPLGNLRTLGLIDYPSPGRVKAQAVLFLD